MSDPPAPDAPSGSNPHLTVRSGVKPQGPEWGNVSYTSKSCDIRTEAGRKAVLEVLDGIV